MNLRYTTPLLLPLILLHTLLTQTHSFLSITPHLTPPPTTTTTTLHGKLWDKLQIEESPTLQWYLINCIPTSELSLLTQCRQACADLPPTDVDRFAVPTEKILRSHGKRNVMDDMVLYSGYVFARVRLCEEVYERISSLVACRSWMGTVRQKGFRKLPVVPEPLTMEEVKRFKGLEAEMEEKETANEEELVKQYAGFEVEGMVKITNGKFAGEDGIVKRLKNGKIFVRMYTYGSQFDDWFAPEELRPLTELEVMRGLGGPEMPINQYKFNEAIGRPNERDLRGRDKRNMRSELMGNVKGMRGQRNRREDRVQRGDRGSVWGTREEMEKEKQNWERYQKRQTDEDWKRMAFGGGEKSGRSGMDDPWGQAKQQKRKQEMERGPRKEELALSDDQDWMDFVSDSKTSTSDDDFFDQLMTDLSGTLDEPPKKDETKQSKTPPKPTQKDLEDDDDLFFSSLMSDLSSTLDSEPTTSPQQPKPQYLDESAEDDFFATLEKEMTASISNNNKTKKTYSSTTTTTSLKSSKRDNDFFSMDENDDDEDDFFATLERELTAESKPKKKFAAAAAAEDDFFLKLQQELTSSAKEEGGDHREFSEDDFFEELEEKLTGGGEGRQNEDLSSLTVKELKEKLKDKGLKVSGNKSELIERLTGGGGGGAFDPSSSSSDDGLSKLTVKDLKEKLREKGLKVSGNKAELIERLMSS